MGSDIIYVNNWILEKATQFFIIATIMRTFSKLPENSISGTALALISSKSRPQKP